LSIALPFLERFELKTGGKHMIELCHICKTYYSKKAGCFEAKALRDISISFPDKGMLFVVGKSGSGKSTLLNVIGGIVWSGGDLADGRLAPGFLSFGSFDCRRDSQHRLPDR